MGGCDRRCTGGKRHRGSVERTRETFRSPVRSPSHRLFSENQTSTMPQEPLNSYVLFGPKISRSPAFPLSGASGEVPGRALAALGDVVFVCTVCVVLLYLD